MKTSNKILPKPEVLINSPNIEREVEEPQLFFHSVKYSEQHYSLFFFVRLLDLQL